MKRKNTRKLKPPRTRQEEDAWVAAILLSTDLNELLRMQRILAKARVHTLRVRRMWLKVSARVQPLVGWFHTPWELRQAKRRRTRKSYDIGVTPFTRMDWKKLQDNIEKHPLKVEHLQWVQLSEADVNCLQP